VYIWHRTGWQARLAAAWASHVLPSLWRGICCLKISKAAVRMTEFVTMPLGRLARRPNVLVVLHQEHSTPGRVGLTLRGMDVRLDIRRPSLGEPLPETLADHDGVVVFGGPMGANDTPDWVRREINSLEVPLGEDKPILGLCLGAQMLARALGARVFSYDDKRSESGYYPIEPTAAGETLCPCAIPRVVYQWHSDGFDLPEGRALGYWGGEFPQPSVPLWPACCWPAVPSGGNLSHDVSVDASRGRASETAWCVQPPRAPGRLVPA
jgi:GMP synthase-like glutamine amidotransferase